jgi:ABC-type dipeptide/oligopeptide/nickel transport system permease subunit
VLAARALGVPQWRIIVNHLLPNTLTPVIVAVTLGVPAYILLEATLSFIGIGAPPPIPSWGLMINDGFNSIFSFPHLVVLPGIAISVTMLSFAFLGDGLRDALDPRARG